MDLLIRQLKHEDLREFQQVVAKFGAIVTVLPGIKTSPKPAVLQKLSGEPVEVNMPLVDGAFVATLNREKKEINKTYARRYQDSLSTQRHRHDHHKLGCGRTHHDTAFTKRPMRHSDGDSDSGFGMDI
ncbi:hypothetical protein HHE06_01090 [Helicobacter heilmannii]|uniref:hypothetical protein n=1 Tax=Helicobacter heilmannii TaxID=35817 RepID=UPI0006A1BFB4|nr:hypothetical protein [Helicobacter heilmannii]CRF48866.1 hypothetical protein HHE03_04500 [Helicobacter heilmannii]CRF50288.1 hypothetical protein HHE06_01090 [Helicobacter heilmannii]